MVQHNAAVSVRGLFHLVLNGARYGLRVESSGPEWRFFASNPFVSNGGNGHHCTRSVSLPASDLEDSNRKDGIILAKESSSSTFDRPEVPKWADVDDSFLDAAAPNSLGLLDLEYGGVLRRMLGSHPAAASAVGAKSVATDDDLPHEEESLMTDTEGGGVMLRCSWKSENPACRE